MLFQVKTGVSLNYFVTNCRKLGRTWTNFTKKEALEAIFSKVGNYEGEMSLSKAFYRENQDRSHNIFFLMF